MTQPPSDKIFKVTETGNLRLLIDPFSVMTADGSSFVYGGGFVDATNNSSGFVVVDSSTGAASVTTNGSDTSKYYLAYVQASQGTARIVQQFENGPYKQNAADGGGTVTTVSVATANGFSGTVANATTTPAITIVAGAIAPTSAAFSGTDGNGFVSLLTQSSDPAAPASGFALYANATGKLSWRRADGWTRTFEVAAATANRTFVIPDHDMTFAGQNYANTFTLANTFSANGALSAPAVSFTGTPITGGTATTTKPMVLVETSGATSTAWSTSGTMLGVNAPNAFAGNMVDFQINGVSRFLVTSGGACQAAIFDLSTSGFFRAGSDTLLTRKAAANWQLGAADAAAPVAQTLSVQSVASGTTDTAGANWTYNASRGTGTGIGGAQIWQVAPAGSTGSSQNALVQGLKLEPLHTGSALRIGANVSTPYIFSITGTANAVSASGTGLSFYSNQTSGTDDYTWAFGGTGRSATSGTAREMALVRSFVPTSGTAVWNVLSVIPTINQTGGANGVTRGLYINPTLTAAADFRAIEVSDGKVVIATSGALSAPAFSLTGTPITGGSSTTTKPLALIETSGATSTNWSTSGTMLGVNAPSGFLGRLFSFQNNAIERVYSTYDGEIGCTNVFITASAGVFRLTSDTILSRKTAANWQLGAADAASPVAQTLSVQSVVAGTSNTAGANFTIKGSLGTGTGASGTLIFQIGTPAASGTTQHAASTGLTLSNVGTSGTAAHRATFAGTVATAGYTVATLPAAGVAGRRAYVTDATAPTYLGALVGGGSVVCPVFDNGSAWVSA